MRFRLILATVLAVVCAVSLLWAQVPADTLTPMGAEKGPNADGNIPAWDGGIKVPPKGYQPGGYHPDPYLEDKPVFVITSTDWEKYKDRLSQGHQAMFRKYADFKMNIYPTRRSASYPAFVDAAVAKNAVTAKLSTDGESINGGSIAVPFPQPKNGLEAIWNHLLRYRGHSVDRVVNQIAALSSGQHTTKIERERIMLPLSKEGTTFDDPANVLAYLKENIMTPPSMAGTLLLVIEPLNKNMSKRRSWIYNPGQKRVTRAPFINYDATPPTDWGLRTFDQYDMYNGDPDMYRWTLEGKQEVFVPYNSYGLADKKPVPEEIAGDSFLKTERTRYELHRVWKVSAQLKEGRKHLYTRRVFYIDEDSWQILLCDIYDDQGMLWRLSEAHVINFYEVPLIMPATEVHYDLKSGDYLVCSLQEEPPQYNTEIPVGEYTPENLRREGAR